MSINQFIQRQCGPEGFRRPAHCVDCDVRQLAVCAALPDSEVYRLEAIMRPKTIAAGERLVEEGAPRQFVYTLTSGMLRLLSDLPDGRRQIAGFLLPGDYLGLADDDVYTQTAEAVSASTLCAFPIQKMNAVMDESPAMKIRLYDLTRRALQEARESQMMLGRLAPVEKVASFLLLLAGRLERHGIVSAPLTLSMNRTDIADHLGLTIETVSRSFTKLKLQGLIGLPEAHLVELTDRRGLMAVAGLNLA
jgi:CRP/FNR family transcriptional regulator